MYLMLLNDQTVEFRFTDLAGCQILHAPDDLDYHQIMEELPWLGFDTCQVSVVRKFGPTPTEGDWDDSGSSTVGEGTSE